MSSKNWMLAGVIVPVVFVAGCLVTTNPHARPVVYAPPLPSIVVFETEPYYVHQGYHYHYQHDRWYYSRSRSGPWTSLPRDCYPREVRYRNAGPGPQIVIAPPLPPIVVFDTEPYYVQEGFHYHYQNNGWYYSRSRSGPWTILPKDRCPHEVRYRDGRSGHDTGPGLQVLIAPPLPPIVVFDTEPYYVQQGYHYHYQNNGWYYSRSRSGPWTVLPKDRCPREVRYKDGRHGDDKGHAPQVTHPIIPDRHQEIKTPAHTFGSDRNRWDSTSGSQRKTPTPTLEPHKRVVTPIPEHREHVQPSTEHKAPVIPPFRHTEAVQPSKEIKPTVKYPFKHTEAGQPSKEIKPTVTYPSRHTEAGQPSKELKPTVTHPFRHMEAVQPAKENKIPVMPLLKQSETVQPQKEREPVVTQPVVRRESVVTPTRESRTPPPERVPGVTPPIVGRSEKTVITPKAQPVAEGKDKEGKEHGKNKEHAR